MIVTLTGASGVGKTSIVREVLKDPRAFGGRVLISYTTRPPRESDLPGEYRHVSGEEFRAIRAEGRFLWTVDVHGVRYGTLKSSVLDALYAPQAISFMILVPDVLERLRVFGRTAMPNPPILSFYILSPSPAVLAERLTARGDEESAIARRLKDCERWDADAAASGIPYIVIENNGSLDDAVRLVRSHLH